MYTEENAWAQEVSEKIKRKMKPVFARNVRKIPYTAKNGVFNDMSQEYICWWTNGFWGGIAWQLYHATGDALYREAAENVEMQLDRNLMDASGMDHDSGFKWLPTAVANYRLHGGKDSLNRALLASDNLAGRFNHAGRFIRAWNGGVEEKKQGWAIIDCMMNLPLLYWAYEQTKDARYLHIARMHADTASRVFLREDGSVRHIVEFDPETGEYLRSHGGQGYAHGSAWSRGQAWAIYGFTLSYLHTKQAHYLETAEKVAAYFIAHLPENGLTPVDFCQPSEPNVIDSTAAAIASCGLIELARVADAERASIYHATAMRMLKALDAHCCNWSENADPLLERGTSSYHASERETPIIYGDYFFIEAIWKLTGQELFLW